MDKDEHPALLRIGFSSFVFYVSNELASNIKGATRPTFIDVISYTLAGAFSNIPAVRGYVSQLIKDEQTFDSAGIFAPIIMMINNRIFTGKIKAFDAIIKNIANSFGSSIVLIAADQYYRKKPEF